MTTAGSVLDSLRSILEPLAWGLTPEDEPATTYVLPEEPYRREEPSKDDLE